MNFDIIDKITEIETIVKGSKIWELEENERYCSYPTFIWKDQISRAPLVRGSWYW